MKKYFISINGLLVLGFLIRLCLIPVTDSSYMSEYFIPFIDNSILKPGLNPWTLSDIKQFPYGLICFLVFYIPKSIGYLLFGSAALGASILSLALMKLPLLAFDFSVLKFLQQFLPHKKKEMYLYYWLNPVLIYLTFAYSHIDIISVAFFIGSLFFLLDKKIILSAIFFGLAFTSKFYVFAVFPFLLIYIWNTYFAKEALLKISQYIAVTLLFIIVGFLPLFLANQFGYVTLSSPEALRLLSLNVDLGQSTVFYLGISFVLIALFRLVLSTKITQHGLFLGSYLIFGILVLICSPSLNWYLWMFPGFIFFYLNYKSFHRVIFLLFNFCLLTQILLLKLWPDVLIANLSFTVTQTVLFLQIVALWIVGLRHEVPLRRRMNPFLIGIAGNSGAGKNHTSVALSDLFGQKATQIIEGDNYHRWQRGHEKWSSFTHLQPIANHLSEMLLHTQDLKYNREITSSHYNHDNGQFTLPQITEPKRLMIFQGLHTFYLNEMRRQLDIKIFVNPEENIRLFWKIQRDVNERKHTAEKVIESSQRRETDAKQYILPQIQFADWVIEFFSVSPYTHDMVLKNQVPMVSMRHILENDEYFLHAMTDILNKHKTGSAMVLDHAEDMTKIKFEVYAEPSTEALHEIIDYLDLPLRQITKSWTPPVWQTGFNGMTQILALVILQKKGFNE